MTEPNDYPDLEPNALGELKSIERFPAMPVRPPKISWGRDYQTWPIEKRLNFAERLAATMNHAADLLQQERNTLLETCKRQEAQLEHQAKAHHELGDFMHERMQIEGAEKQELYAQIVELTKEIKALKRGD